MNIFKFRKICFLFLFSSYKILYNLHSEKILFIEQNCFVGFQKVLYQFNQLFWLNQTNFANQRIWLSQLNNFVATKTKHFIFRITTLLISEKCASYFHLIQIKLNLNLEKKIFCWTKLFFWIPESIISI